MLSLGNVSFDTKATDRGGCMHVLLVEDDKAYAETVARILERFGLDFESVSDGEKAVRFLKSQPVDLVILDWQLPGMSGFEVLHWIRTKVGPEPAVLFLSARVLEVDIVLALEAGADDYIVKPFRLAELAARVNVLLRRSRKTKSGNESDVIAIGDYELSPRHRTVMLRGQSVELTEKEFDLALFFFSNIGKPISREVVSKNTWGRELDAASRTLDTHIYRIRQKLSISPQNGVRLSSIYNHGYRLELVTAGAGAAEARA